MIDLHAIRRGTLPSPDTNTTATIPLVGVTLRIVLKWVKKPWMLPVEIVHIVDY
jgi:hypothetical protein